MDKEKLATCIMDSLKLYLDSLDNAYGKERSQRSGICGNCQSIANFEFMVIPYAQNAIVTCTCGEKVIVKYYP